MVLDNQRAKYAITLIANAVMLFTLSYLPTMGASTIKRELLTTYKLMQFYKPLFSNNNRVTSDVLYSTHAFAQNKLA